MVPYVCRLCDLEQRWWWEDNPTRSRIAPWLARCKSKKGYAGISTFLNSAYLRLMSVTGTQASSQIRAILGQSKNTRVRNKRFWGTRAQEPSVCSSATPTSDANWAQPCQLSLAPFPIANLSTLSCELPAHLSRSSALFIIYRLPNYEIIALFGSATHSQKPEDC
jgi:hypothetical protein